jgi:hypothetical protein
VNELKNKILLTIFVFSFLSVLNTSFAAKPASQTCRTIQSGELKAGNGDTLSVGYDKWGYNYQAKMFNGFYDNYSRPTTPVTDGDKLMMKWNDAWLSNQNCDDDDLLDRHLGYDTYRGSGAWLTNHMSGTYESSNYMWDISGDWVFSINSGAYLHDYTFTMTALEDGTFTGVGGYPAGAVDYTFDEVVIDGQITGDAVTFTAVYYVNGLPTGYTWSATGTIHADGHMSGTGTSGVTTWTTTSGKATKITTTCDWSDFVKIVAVPTDAVLYGGMWYTDSSMEVEIGPEIWGEFAIIQEVTEDECGEFNLADYRSELKSGLGNWQD